MRTYKIGPDGQDGRCYYGVNFKRMQLGSRVVKVVRFDSIIPPMHTVRFVAYNLHSGGGIDPGSSEIRTGRMAEIVDPEVRDASTPTGGLKPCPDPFNRMIVIQEHPMGV